MPVGTIHGACERVLGAAGRRRTSRAAPPDLDSKMDLKHQKFNFRDILRAACFQVSFPYRSFIFNFRDLPSTEFPTRFKRGILPQGGSEELPLAVGKASGTLL